MPLGNTLIPFSKPLVNCDVLQPSRFTLEETSALRAKPLVFPLLPACPKKSPMQFPSVWHPNPCDFMYALGSVMWGGVADTNLQKSLS